MDPRRRSREIQLEFASLGRIHGALTRASWHRRLQTPRSKQRSISIFSWIQLLCIKVDVPVCSYGIGQFLEGISSITYEKMVVNIRVLRSFLFGVQEKSWNDVPDHQRGCPVFRPLWADRRQYKGSECPVCPGSPPSGFIGLKKYIFLKPLDDAYITESITYIGFGWYQFFRPLSQTRVFATDQNPDS